MTNERITPKPGLTIHLRTSVAILVNDSEQRMFNRGSELVLTDSIIRNTRDREGNTWLDLTPEEQTRVYGKQLFGWGPVPEDVEYWNAEGDTATINIARERALKAAEEYSDPAERRAQIDAVHEKYGRKAAIQSLGFVGARR